MSRLKGFPRVRCYPYHLRHSNTVLPSVKSESRRTSSDPKEVVVEGSVMGDGVRRSIRFLLLPTVGGIFLVSPLFRSF